MIHGHSGQAKSDVRLEAGRFPGHRARPLNSREKISQKAAHPPGRAPRLRLRADSGASTQEPARAAPVSDMHRNANICPSTSKLHTRFQRCNHSRALLLVSAGKEGVGGQCCSRGTLPVTRHPGLAPSRARAFCTPRRSLHERRVAGGKRGEGRCSAPRAGRRVSARGA